MTALIPTMHLYSLKIMIKNFRSTALLILSLQVCIGTTFSQPPRRAAPAQLHENGLATVYIYRFDEDTVVSNLFFWFIKARPVYFGDPPSQGAKPSYRKIAALRNKEYFLMRLPARTYIFKTRSMWGRLEIDLAAGFEYHLWVDQGKDCPTEDPTWGPPSCEDRTASITKVTSDRWLEHKTSLRPIRNKQAKDRSLVLIPPASPS